MGEADVTLNQTDEKPPDSALVPGEDSVVWSHEVEVCLFHAMIGHKPVGETRTHGQKLLAAAGSGCSVLPVSPGVSRTGSPNRLWS